MSDSSPAYIGVKPCGCVTFAMVLGYDTPAQEAKEVARVIKSGRRIEQVTAKEARERMTFECGHEEAA